MPDMVFGMPVTGFGIPVAGFCLPFASYGQVIFCFGWAFTVIGQLDCY
jgi:hypothetical protein